MEVIFYTEVPNQTATQHIDNLDRLLELVKHQIIYTPACDVASFKDDNQAFILLNALHQVVDELLKIAHFEVH